jgi:hypothetical protein
MYNLGIFVKLLGNFMSFPLFIGAVLFAFCHAVSEESEVSQTWVIKETQADSDRTLLD